MKLLFCARCNDIKAPDPTPRATVNCRCGAFHVWWEDPGAGIIRVYPSSALYKNKGWLIGIHNWLLVDESAVTQAETVKMLLENTPDTYVFKQAGTPAVKFRPGFTGDSAWATRDEFEAASNLFARLKQPNTDQFTVITFKEEIVSREAT